ncbi:helix-turn-helix domain-containing protein [Streptomyces sp. NPDC051561]|uniref:helix-turn-helix domain-containing protein n=1 Tax=Streptomyces sp. NPDC051561 TaxID=3365658 RepID=UPI0037A58C5D
MVEKNLSPRAGVHHVKYRHTDRFTVVGNHLSQHAELSLTAIGLAVHIQSLPDGKRIGIKELTEKFPEGELRIAAALRELVLYGYLERVRRRGADGRFVTCTTYFEHPSMKLRAEFAVLPPPPPPPPAPALAPLPAPSSEDTEPTQEIRLSPTPLRLPLPVPRTEVTPDRLRTAHKVLAELRTHDPRLLLSARDVERLAPAVCAWLERHFSPFHVQDVLVKGLGEGPVRHPAGLVEWRLSELLPYESLEPPRPLYGTPPVVERRDPLQTCESCGLAYRAPERGGLCRTCQEESDADLAAFVRAGGLAS